MAFVRVQRKGDARGLWWGVQFNRAFMEKSTEEGTGTGLSAQSSVPTAGCISTGMKQNAELSLLLS